MLRTARYKYVALNGGERPEQLFDLKTDPGENVNLARVPAGQSELRRHRQLLKEWIHETADDFVNPAPGR
jgi:arylsulfatase A-like enzyme